MIHELKCWPSSFERISDGTKTFEVRRDDRGFQMGDVLRLREWDYDRAFELQSPERGFTGREVERVCGVIFRQGFGVDLGEFVVIALIHPAAHAATSEVMQT